MAVTVPVVRLCGIGIGHIVVGAEGTAGNRVVQAGVHVYECKSTQMLMPGVTAYQPIGAGTKITVVRPVVRVAVAAPVIEV